MKNLLQHILPAALLACALNAPAQDFNLVSRSTMDFSGQTLANICGYTQNGREYALLGGSLGMIVVDITDPDNPVNIVQIPAPEGPENSGSLWKEIKVYQNYAYLTTEAGGGLQIINLSNLPNNNLVYHSYTGDGAIDGQLNSIHALHIDVTAGFVYLHGSNLFDGAPVVLDLNNDPYNPTYAGVYDQLGYVHDGYADNDTLYAAHIYDGLLAVVDMSDKQNPIVLGTVETPGKFTHNTWPLADSRIVLTTDEATPSFVTAYDVSDPTDIQELDRVSTNDGNNSIGHNTHVRNDWAITSWYSDGVVIIDAHKPDNLVITGLYDTWPQGSGANFNGCWGAFPYFPSGTIVTSNIEPARLTVLTPAYVRAAYLEGSVTNGCNGLPLSGVTVDVSGNDPWVDVTTGADGTFKTGQTATGSFTVTFSKTGFLPTTVNINLATAQVTDLNVTLEAGTTYDIDVTALSTAGSAPIANSEIYLENGDQSYYVTTDANGQFDLDCIVAGAYAAGAWGFQPGVLTVAADGATTLSLEPLHYYDDFQLDLGWSVVTTSSSGEWVRDVPIGTTYQGDACNPGDDAAVDANDECYVTGNGGGDAGADDVDGGATTLTTPPMQLAAYDDAVLSFWYWFVNDGGSGDPNDNLTVTVSNGAQTATVFTEDQSESAWNFSGDIHLADFIALTDNVRVSFVTADQQPGHLVEAAVDVFSVVPEVSSGADNIDPQALVQVLPNPSSTDFALQYHWPNIAGAGLEVRNLLGQAVLAQSLNGATGTTRFGADWPRGVYLATLRSADGRQSAPVKVVKQ